MQYKISRQLSLIGPNGQKDANVIGQRSKLEVDKSCGPLAQVWTPKTSSLMLCPDSTWNQKPHHQRFQHLYVRKFWGEVPHASQDCFLFW